MATSLATTLRLDSRFVTDLPELAIPWQAEEAPEPTVVAVNEQLAVDLGLDPEWLRSSAGVRALLGQDLPAGSQPVAQAYTGHQFGMLAPRLGDGRALLLGELTSPDGTLHDLHLKGSGRTPFSRGGDGRAALGPMLREHLVSESLHALGVPTTRSLAVIGTGRTILREDGYHPGAVLVRVAASHLRVGSFEYARTLESPGLVRRLAEHAVHRHAPETDSAESPARGLLATTVTTQAWLMAQWLSVGFVHGVMNTDNMTISGETIDYGPCAFVDGLDPAAVFSSIDTGGRYAYGRQPAIAQWNLTRFAETLLPLLHDDPNAAVEAAQDLLATFPRHFGQAWAAAMRAKLGLNQEVGDDVAGPLADELLALMAAGRTDFTSFFRRLGQHTEHGDDGPLTGAVADAAALTDWLERWRALGPDPELMGNSNPAYIPRNHLAEEALTAAEAGDLEPFEQLLGAVRDPFREREGLARFGQPAPEGHGPHVTYCGT
ncbi:protein adenylyltransferase SelO [Citricoccus nitrophenolicus]|uniref:protein adenylyltransferase SelO n=1 Tax=Citricoccus nitrophenolicus TaxID=863575 RepID=UPI0039B45D79